MAPSMAAESTVSGLSVVMVVAAAAVKSISQGPKCSQLVITSARPAFVLISLVLATTVAAGHQQHHSARPATRYLENSSNNVNNHRQQPTSSPKTKTTTTTTPPPTLLALERDTDYHQGSSLNRDDTDSRSKRDNMPAASTMDSTGEDVDFIANVSEPTDAVLGPTPASNELQANSTVAGADGQLQYPNQFHNGTNHQAITHQELQMEPEDVATDVGQTGGLDDRLAIRLQKSPVAASDLTVAYDNELEYDNPQPQRVTHQKQADRKAIIAAVREQETLNSAARLIADRQMHDQHHQQQQHPGSQGVIYNDDTGDEERNLLKLYEDELIHNLYSKQPIMINSTNNNSRLQQHQPVRRQSASEVQQLGAALRIKQTGKTASIAAKARLALPQPYHQVPTFLPPYTVMKGSGEDQGPSYQTMQDVAGVLTPLQQQQQQHQLQHQLRQYQLQQASSPKPQSYKVTRKLSQLAEDKQQQQPVAAASSSTKKPRGLFKVSGSRQHPTIVHEDPFRIGQSQQLSLIPLQTGSNSQILGIIGALPASQTGVAAPLPAVANQAYQNRHPIGIGQVAHSDYNNNNNQQALGADSHGGYSTRYLYSPRGQYSGNRNSYQPIAQFNRVGANFLHRTGFVTSPATGIGSGGYQTSEDNSPGAQASSMSSSTSEPMWSDSRHQEDDYQQSPQTIQITAVPNGLGLNNGFGVNNGWNGWNGGLNGGWNGRQVLLVNRQPQLASQWRDWMLPVAIVLALPLILGALFLPVMLKSVMFLIQILQMLGLLMPPAQLAGHIASHASPPG